MITRAGLAALKSQGAAGAAVLHDVDVYLEGMNARMEADGGTRPYTRADIFAFNAIIGQIFGQGGGDEARRSEFYSALVKKYGASKGAAMFDDFSEFNDPDAPTSISTSFPYGKADGPGKGNAVLDAGSFKPIRPEGAGIGGHRSRAGRATS